MKHGHRQSPVLVRLYHEYLSNVDSALFIHSVSQRYTSATLERLVEHGAYIERRAAVLALGFLGRNESCAVLSRALIDSDRGVRMLADDAMRAVWCRAGNEAQRHHLRMVIRLNACLQFKAAIDRAEQLLRDAPQFAEAWNQRAIAQYHLEDYECAIADCEKTLELNPYHFCAAAGMGRCYLAMDAPAEALEHFCKALDLNPELEGVRAMVAVLRRATS